MKPFALFALILCLVACSENSSTRPSENSSAASEVAFETDSLHAGMVKVFANGAAARLGTNDSGAKANERPQMTAKFSYDFSIGKREVTCGEFSELVPGFDCENSLPITDVTFYDAALYANARSKSENLDTAYAYTAAAFDSEGHCTNLEGFEFLPEADAYRLPTEAEWILVAAQSWNTSKAWTSENSGYGLHEPCSAGDTADVCDMAGNAMEWSNDLLGKFSDTTVTNFIGSRTGGSLGERVVKGGSFRNAAANISLHGRGDVYTVTSATRADYVGFRLAFGKIPSASSLDADKNVSEYDVKILTSASRLKTALGTYRAVLAFRDDETSDIAYVNFMSSDPHVIEIADTIDAYHPAVSPDGKRVAFSTRPEGISGKSELYVRNLDANGSGLVKLDVESAAIPRWRVTGADTQIVYVTSAGNNSDAAEWKLGATYAVSFAGGKFGEPEKLFDGTYNAGISADGELAVSGARLLRASVGGKDETWYAGEQACNASLSDSAKRTLFLDFGGAPGVEFAGQSYNAHKMLLVADSAGSLSQMIPSPAGYEFDHTEWVRGSERLAVATLTDDEGAHSKIILLDTRDSSVLELASGAELWHPDLWVGERKNSNVKPDPDTSAVNPDSGTVNPDTANAHFELDPDSAGAYYTSAGTLGDYVLRIKMELLWRYKDSANVVVLGSSRPLDAVSAQEFSSDYFVLNLAQTPNSMRLSKELLENYVYPHVSNLKYLIISLDIDLWLEQDSLERYTQTYPGYAYDKNNGYWKNGVPEDFLEFVENSPGNRDDDPDLYRVYAGDHGRAYMGCISWGGEEPHIVNDSTLLDSRSDLLDYNLEILRDIISSASGRNVHVVGLILPQSPAYKTTGAYGRHGLRRSTAKTLIEKIQALESQNFTLMDENKFGDHDYTDDMAMDFDHLCYQGAAQISSRLDSLLQNLDSK